MVTLEPSALPDACALIGRAFAADPFARYAIPQADRRPELLATLFQTIVSGGLRYGRVLATSAQLTGVACWLPPGNELLGLGQQILCGGLRVPFRVPWAVMRAYREYEKFASLLHRKHAPTPHWYLVPLAVEPALQGQGFGTALLQEGLDRADADRLPCFLETQNPRNVPLYERHGFTVVERTVVPSTRIDHFCMLRAVGNGR